jgi:hypothetical protein
MKASAAAMRANCGSNHKMLSVEICSSPTKHGEMMRDAPRTLEAHSMICDLIYGILCISKGTFAEHELCYQMIKLCSIGDFQVFNLDRKHELLREFQEVNHQISGAKRSHASLNVVKSWQFKQLGWIAEYKHGALKVDFLVFCFNRGQQWWYADRGRSARRDLHPFLGMPFVGSHEIFKWDINIRVKHIIHIYIYSSIYPIYPFFSPHLGKAVLLIACCQTSSAVLFCHLAIAWHFCASTPQWH